MKLMLSIIFYLVWIQAIFFFSSSTPEFPQVRERLGTILWHTQDGTPAGALTFHTYCYYPKQAAKTNLIIKREDSGDCSNWYGKAVLPEGNWVSEREKYWWCPSQLYIDTFNCNDVITPLSSNSVSYSFVARL